MDVLFIFVMWLRHFLLWLVAVALLLVAACATPPGQMQRSDFAWSAERLDATPIEVHRRLYNGFRHCGSETGGVVFVTAVGVPECAPPAADGKLVCDVFSAGVYGGRSDWVLGRIEVRPRDGEGSEVLLGVRLNYVNESKTRALWHAFARGEEPCAR